eukprot:7340224-Pyramimonas_sp.AAC.1
MSLDGVGGKKQNRLLGTPLRLRPIEQHLELRVEGDSVDIRLAARFTIPLNRGGLTIPGGDAKDGLPLARSLALGAVH